jgi:DNA-binding transcriptional MerR regulator
MTSLATLSMAALAERSGVDEDTIEKYQRLGLVSWRRKTSQGLTLYSPDEVAHVTFVKKALALDFPVSTIRDMLGRVRRKPSTCATFTPSPNYIWQTCAARSRGWRRSRLHWRPWWRFAAARDRVKGARSSQRYRIKQRR